MPHELPHRLPAKIELMNARYKLKDKTTSFLIQIVFVLRRHNFAALLTDVLEWLQDCFVLLQLASHLEAGLVHFLELLVKLYHNMLVFLLLLLKLHQQFFVYAGLQKVFIHAFKVHLLQLLNIVLGLPKRILQIVALSLYQLPSLSLLYQQPHNLIYRLLVFISSLV